MSIFSAFSFLNLRPEIEETEHSILVRTGFAQRLFSLFTASREVEIIPSDKYLHVRTKGLGASDDFTVGFNELWYVEYKFSTTPSRSSLLGEDEVETFRLSVITKNKQRIPICFFRGDAAPDSGWTGALLGNSLIDYTTGTQEAESRSFARYIAEVLELPMGKPMEAEANMDRCEACGQRMSAYAQKCLYCGTTRD